MIKLNARQLRKTKPTEDNFKGMKKNPIYIVCDRVYDTYNIGSIFRLADAVSARKVYLCGDMEYPPSSKIHKSAVGTEGWVLWEKKDNVSEVIKELKEKGIQIISVEQSKNSVDYKDFKPQFPCAIVVGHETDGVSKEALNLSDIIVELPMFGVNKSLNVWGSAAIIAYKILEFI